ncbi:hypothetical protein L3Q82_019113 [Scortum barcoo]|uniref:Uncharacterized protein n=1 Tax=Scortum barcoo TaxID=214431 RepID=A0ACB8VJ98_9TELE|nr:hypothetical protein L3Q82_019113 [Scortum barcoo]
MASSIYSNFKFSYASLIVLQVNAEFTRITTKPLVSTFMFQLDHYTDPLLKAFRKKGGTAGLKITGIKAAMGKLSMFLPMYILATSENDTDAIPC